MKFSDRFSYGFSDRFNRDEAYKLVADVQDVPISCGWNTTGVHCILLSQVCDRVVDCPNGVDESNCGKKSRTVEGDNVEVIDKCAQLRHLLPNGCSGIPMAHSPNCTKHRLPWRMEQEFLQLENVDGFLCNGTIECADGLDEMLYVCSNWRLHHENRRRNTTQMHLVHFSPRDFNGSTHPLCTYNLDRNSFDPWIPYDHLYVDILPLFNLTLSDCVHMCVHLSNMDWAKNVTRVDIGQSWMNYKRDDPANQFIWNAGSCHMVGYQYFSSQCELLHVHADCSSERIAEGVS